MKLASRRSLSVAVALALAVSASAALAQSANSNNASNSAVNAGNTASGQHMVANSALQKGSNSFTEGEARSRLESAGLSDVTGLKKDNSGIWRGKAKRNGKSVNVGLDYKGEISAQ